MSVPQDKLSLVKNLIRMMCCDGKISSREKKFLAGTAKEVDLKVEDWNSLVKQVNSEASALYPIDDRDRAVATLKSMIVMAKADRKVDEQEKKFLVQFAKSIGVSNAEWKQINKHIQVGSLFEPFKTKVREGAAVVTVLKDDFDKLEEFTETAQENGIQIRTAGFDEFIAGDGNGNDMIFFHASEQRDTTVRKCKALLDKCGQRTVAVLAQFQGYQVQYLLEIGLVKCIIEPVYSNDFEKMFSVEH
jgi:uncharacterized tellurite resistance protein B-like protein